MIEIQVTTTVKHSPFGSGKWIDKQEVTWKKFYPIKELCMDLEIFDSRPLSEMEDMMYGKYVSGTSGYNPTWTYLTVEKSKLRETTPKPN
jgi:hypothetical protein